MDDKRTFTILNNQVKTNYDKLKKLSNSNIKDKNNIVNYTIHFYAEQKINIFKSN